MDEVNLLDKIHKLSRELKINISSEIEENDLYKAMLIETKALKYSISNGPKIIEICAVIISGLALLLANILFLINFTSDTEYYFSENSVNSNLIEEGNILNAKYLIKSSFDQEFIMYIFFIYGFINLIFIIIGWLLYKQFSSSKNMKKLSILEQNLEKYLELK